MAELSRSLGSRALALLEAWEASNTRLVTSPEIRSEMGADTTAAAARKMTSRLRQKGFLQAVGRGVYAVQPLAWMGTRAGDAAASVAGLSGRGVKFYVGFDTAAGHYGWNPEGYGVVTVGIPTGTRARMPEVEGVRIRAVTVPASTFSLGILTERWRGQVVPMSSRELTCVDAVSRANLVGGYPACLRLLSRARLDDRVVLHLVAEIAAARMSTRLRKRLGWLTERAGWKWSGADLELLRSGWSKNHRVMLASSRQGPQGHWDARWELIVNVPDDQLEAEVGIR